MTPATETNNVPTQEKRLGPKRLHQTYEEVSGLQASSPHSSHPCLIQTRVESISESKTRKSQKILMWSVWVRSYPTLLDSEKLRHHFGKIPKIRYKNGLAEHERWKVHLNAFEMFTSRCRFRNLGNKKEEIPTRCHPLHLTRE